MFLEQRKTTKIVMKYLCGGIENTIRYGTENRSISTIATKMLTVFPVDGEADA
jgi:hypothetical protein